MAIVCITTIRCTPQATHCNIVLMLLFKIGRYTIEKFIKSYCPFNLYLQYKVALEAIP